MSIKGSRDQKFEKHCCIGWNLEETTKEEVLQLQQSPVGVPGLATKKESKMSFSARKSQRPNFSTGFMA